MEANNGYNRARKEISTLRPLAFRRRGTFDNPGHTIAREKQKSRAAEALPVAARRLFLAPSAIRKILPGAWMSQESRDVAHRCSALLASHAYARVCAALACPQRCGEPSLKSSLARNPVECQPGHRDDKAHGAVQMKKFVLVGWK